MKRVVVASKNPVKINAAREGFERMFPNDEFEVVGVEVASGVSDQPMSDEETKRGAMNRVENASMLEPAADYWAAFEGGALEDESGEFCVFAWMIVKSKEGKIGKGRTSVFFLPPAVSALMREGKELAEADSIVFGRENSKHKNGIVGLLTGDVVDRTRYYTDAAIMALIPFKNDTLY